MLGGQARFPVLFAVVLAGLGASDLVACGSSVPPPKPPPPPAPARLSRQLEASLASLEMPSDLLLAGRWKNPGALLGQLEAWSGGTLSLESWLRTRLGEPSRPIDLSAPIELLAVL